MTNTKCPSNRLSQLVGNELSPQDSAEVIEHLESCPRCQEKLESISADETWWEKAREGLSELDVDEQYRIPESETNSCSIDTLLLGGESTGYEISSETISAMLGPPGHPEMLGQIDEFEIEEKIGQGGMGVVFRGFDRSLNRPVAIKVMSPHLAANPVAGQRFEREARAAAAVVHPNVVPIYRVSTEKKGRPYIAMALADGLSLQEHVNRYGPFDVKDVMRISIQIASGLAEAHKQGVIHRDIKPANVLMEKDVSRIMITDFGLARAADDVMMTQSGCLAGTPSYMSPEQVMGGELDHRSDLFSLGSLMYFIATGREPFQAENAFATINKVTSVSPKPARHINIDIPEILNRIIERLLEKKPENRIESAAKLEQVLTQVLAHQQKPKQHTLPEVRATTFERQRTAKRVGGWLAFAAILMVVFLFWSGVFGSINAPPGQTQPGHTHPDTHEHEHAAEHGEGFEGDNGEKHD